MLLRFCATAISASLWSKYEEPEIFPDSWVEESQKGEEKKRKPVATNEKFHSNENYTARGGLKLEASKRIITHGQQVRTRRRTRGKWFFSSQSACFVRRLLDWVGYRSRVIHLFCPGGARINRRRYEVRERPHTLNDECLTMDLFRHTGKQSVQLNCKTNLKQRINHSWHGFLRWWTRSILILRQV